MPLELRGYQAEAVQMALCENTIINMATGCGKTQIAVVVLDHYLQKYPTKTVLFVAPTCALIRQHALYIRQESQYHDTRVIEMAGMDLDGWPLRLWDDARKQYNVFVGTPEIFRNAMVTQGYVQPEHFSLLVLDECHNATGNHPMAVLLRDGFFKVPRGRNEFFRILGLTASFNSGAGSDDVRKLEKKRSALEALLNATLRNITPSDEFIQEKTYHTVGWEANEAYPEDIKANRKALIQDVIVGLVEPELLAPEELPRWSQRGWNVCEELGEDALYYWLKEGLIQTLASEALGLLSSPNSFLQRKAQKVLNKVKDVKVILASRLQRYPVLADISPHASGHRRTHKFMALVSVLRERLTRNEKGIVFVEQVAMTYPMAYLVNDEMQRTVMMPVSGQNSMSETIRNENLQRFRTGEFPLLVSTNALEEGIHVPGCEFVIRYDAFGTTKSHIQGSGRARAPWAHIYYFANDPTNEKHKESLLQAVAGNEELSLSASQKAAELERMQREAAPKDLGGEHHKTYPFMTSKGARVDFFNCVQLFHNYIAKVMRTSLPLEGIFLLYDGELEGPSSLRIPTPQGLLSLTKQDVDQCYWCGRGVEDFVSIDSIAKMDGKERERRRFLWAACYHLHEMEYLTPNNEPSTEALELTKATCEVILPAKEMTRINVTFKTSSVEAEGSRPLGHRLVSQIENMNLGIPGRIQPQQRALSFQQPSQSYPLIDPFGTSESLTPSNLPQPLPLGAPEGLDLRQRGLNVQVADWVQRQQRGSVFQHSPVPSVVVPSYAEGSESPAPYSLRSRGGSLSGPQVTGHEEQARRKLATHDLSPEERKRVREEWLRHHNQS